jgi:hypothetical protein
MADPKITGVDWSLVNEDAATWAREYGGQLVKEIDEKTRRDVGNAVGKFYSEGQTMGKLNNSLGMIYSPQRAERIAITEVTRAAAEGEREIANELAKEGILMVEVWETRNDLVVCAICEPRHGKKENDGWTRDQGPPGHPNCRCNIRHEFAEPKEGALEIEQEALGGIQPSIDVYSDEEWDKIVDWYTKGFDVDDQEDRAYIKELIANDIAERSGLEYDKVDQMIRKWASTSNDNDASALHLQERASEMFGIDLSDWQKQKIKMLSNKTSSFTDAEVDKFLKAMYENTQDQFRAAGIDTVKLSRGIDLPMDDLYRMREAGYEGIKEGDTIAMKQNVMESWTLNEQTAEDFGNLIIEVDVPVDRIIGNARTGFGCFSEYEFIVLGSDAEELATILSILG